MAGEEQAQRQYRLNTQSVVPLHIPYRILKFKAVCPNLKQQYQSLQSKLHLYLISDDAMHITTYLFDLATGLVKASYSSVSGRILSGLVWIYFPFHSKDAE